MRAGENSPLFQSQSERVQQLTTAPAERTYFRVDTLNLLEQPHRPFLATSCLRVPGGLGGGAFLPCAL